MTDYLTHFPKPFLDDMVQGRCLPFLGAGFSLNAKIPAGKEMLDWEGLGKKVAMDLPEYQYTTALEALSAYSHEFSRVKLVEFLGSALLINAIQPAKTHEQFCRLPFERVATTNFDFLLEQAYAKINKYCIPLISEDQLAVGDPQAGVRLLKLHGDLHHPNRLVVTEEDYDSFLTNLPLLATHLSSLLIDHTALFIGYSLDDPDFRQIWSVVKDRLGGLRRPAYVLQVGAASHHISRYERRGVKVINLPKTHGRSYSQILEQTFRELLHYWTSNLISLSTSTEADPQAELSLPASAQSRLAFFSVPTRYAAFYKSRVYPIAERYGFSPVMAAEVVAPGDNLMAKIYALIERSALVVADVTSPNTLFEVGMVTSKEGASKPMILITDNQTSIPFDISHYPSIKRPRVLDEEPEEFIRELEQSFIQEFEKLSPALEDEPSRLFAKKEYRAAVIAVFSLLEYELRQILESSDKTGYSTRVSLSNLLEFAKSRDLMSAEDYRQVRTHLSVRNKLTHTRQEISQQNAKAILREIKNVINHVRTRHTQHQAEHSTHSITNLIEAI
ncbi:SIR2 family NAD-dependent protein deacylase [Massilia timonae]|uniref:SIR2 family NAD-dependent protein deacylase n=1 Tax=Massilia timonae TaxID=47229 RepID=UPI00289DAA8A|nr:SIR2 family protein [Massilia timonae]